MAWRERRVQGRSFSIVAIAGGSAVLAPDLILPPEEERVRALGRRERVAAHADGAAVADRLAADRAPRQREHVLLAADGAVIGEAGAHDPQYRSAPRAREIAIRIPFPRGRGTALGGFRRRAVLLESPALGGVAQLVRASGSYPLCPGFKSLHRHHDSPDWRADLSPEASGGAQQVPDAARAGRPAISAHRSEIRLGDLVIAFFVRLRDRSRTSPCPGSVRTRCRACSRTF